MTQPMQKPRQKSWSTKTRYWLEAKVTFAVLGLLRLLPMRSAIKANAKLFQFLGPNLPQHKIVIDNLSQAYPNKSEAERNQIAVGVWRNFGRLVAEYIFIDRLFTGHNLEEKQNGFEIEGKAIIDRITSAGKPCIFFTAHLGNFELLPIVAAAHGLEINALFRPPNNPYIAEKLLRARRTKNGNLVPAKSGAVRNLVNALKDGKSIGVLVDQKFQAGLRTTFFDRPATTNPLLARLAKQFNVPVYPVKCIRLRGGRFKLIIEDALEIPRDSQGVVNVDATAQLLNDTVERWVRETPEQWMWMHRRWQI